MKNKNKSTDSVSKQIHYATNHTSSISNTNDQIMVSVGFRSRSIVPGVDGTIYRYFRIMVIKNVNCLTYTYLLSTQMVFYYQNMLHCFDVGSVFMIKTIEYV